MADNQPRDEHAKHLKQSVSKVKQLRGWVASDPSRVEEFVDALNEATALRLLSRAWAEAAPEATEAVGAADRLVASRGPVGPYTPLVDAGRYFTALTHVATVQSGMNLPEAAGRTAAAAFAWKDQLTRDGLADELAARTAVWALLALARGALATGDLTQANAQADAALLRARQAGLDGDQTPVLLEALRTDADTRFAVGLADEAIALLREAVSIWREWTSDDLAQLPRMAKPHLERLVSAVVMLQRDLADRLEHQGRGDEAAAVREELSTLLHRTAARRGEPGRVDLALARADQALTLARAGRAPEAARAAEDAQQALQALYKAEKPVGAHLPTQALVATTLAEAELVSDNPERAGQWLEQLEHRMQAHRGVVVQDAARALALHLGARVARARGEDGAELEAQASTLLDGVLAQPGEREHHGHLDAGTLLRAHARGTVLPSQQPTPHWEVPDPVASLAPSKAMRAEQLSDEEAMRRIDEARQQEARERAAAEEREAAARAERERQQEIERAERRARLEREQAERDAAQEQLQQQHELDQAAAELTGEEPVGTEPVVDPEELQQERLAAQERDADLAAARLAAQQQAAEQAERERAEREQAERERTEAERLARERAIAEQQHQAEQQRQEAEHQRQEAERADRERVEQERLAAERAEQERREADPLVALREAARRARSTGSRDELVATHQALADELEWRAPQDPQGLGRELVDTLERISDAQGWLRGRAVGRRAKQLAREFGLS